MKQTTKALPLFTGLLLGLSTAASIGIAQARGLSFEQMDADNNGMVSEQEFYDARNKHIAERAKAGRQMRGLKNMPSFADIDENGDAALSEEEFSKFKRKRMMQKH